jgi:hypothetical protein
MGIYEGSEFFGATETKRNRPEGQMKIDDVVCGVSSFAYGSFHSHHKQFIRNQWVSYLAHAICVRILSGEL